MYVIKTKISIFVDVIYFQPESVRKQKLKIYILLKQLIVFSALPHARIIHAGVVATKSDLLLSFSMLDNRAVYIRLSDMRYTGTWHTHLSIYMRYVFRFTRERVPYVRCFRIPYNPRSPYGLKCIILSFARQTYAK